jgi:lipopolysaccharide transport system ATP-binding protein
MYMRLGFSIAIHVRPDILLVDEVLAVGDQAFQLRCLDKINEMKRRGITIILVTHDLNAVRELCDRVIWLEDGHKEADGSIDRVLEQYMLQVQADDRHALQKAEAGRKRSKESGPSGDGVVADEASQPEESKWRWGSREAEIMDVQFLDGEGQERRSFLTGDTLVARIHYVAHKPVENPLFGVALHHADGFQICGPNTQFSEYAIEVIDGVGYVDFVIPHLPLLQGTFLFSAALYDAKGQHALDHHHMAYTLRIKPGKEILEKYGSVYIPSRWQLGAPAGLQGTASDRDDGQ